jgi:hypothetical protein
MLLYNHICTVVRKPCANREPVCALEISNCAENFVLLALKFQWMVVCRKLPGGASISHYTPNECFLEGQFNVSAQSLTFELGLSLNYKSSLYSYNPDGRNR